MRIETARLIYFSPTGTTKKVLFAICDGLNVRAKNVLDLTMPELRENLRLTIEEDIVVIGVPVYAEKIPYFLHDCLKNIHGNGKLAVLVSVYGNIGEGIALNQLQTLCGEIGLNVVGGASFIGEHSFSKEKLPVASGRPDLKDISLAERFGREINKKLVGTDSLSDALITLPEGKLPLVARILPQNSERIVTRQPKADLSLCKKCGICFKKCPMGSIHPETLEIKEELCVRCFSCVKNCPAEARKITFKKRWVVMTYLKKNGEKRKEPITYF